MNRLKVSQAFPILGAIILALVIVSCGNDEPRTNKDDPRSAVSAVIGKKGGTITFRNEVSVQIPPGTLSESITVTVTRAAGDSQSPNPPSIMKPVGSTYNIDAQGATLLKRVTLEFRYDRDSMPGGPLETAVFLAFYDEEEREWIPIGGTVDRRRGVVSIQTSHLSWWNPVSWNWDAWTVVLTNILSLEITNWLDASRLSTAECDTKTDSVVATNESGSKVLKGCITEASAGTILSVTNLKSFYINASCKPVVPGCRNEILAPGKSLEFSVDPHTMPSPLIVTGGFSGDAFLHTLLLLFLQFIPAGDLIPVEGISSFATLVQEAFGGVDGFGATSALQRLADGDIWCGRSTLSNPQSRPFYQLICRLGGRIRQGTQYIADD